MPEDDSSAHLCAVVLAPVAAYLLFHVVLALLATVG